MATEDSIEPPPPAPAPSTPAPTLPEYPKMIMAAIEALNESEGSNKTSIAQQIESTYGELPAAHATLLSHHLNQMKQSGELAFVKNNYMKPDPNAPPKRGRGRPPKAKAPPPEGAAAVAAAAVVSSPPRPRGRPPKVKDSTESSAPSPSTGSGRPRGRPPKKAKTTPAPATSPASGAPRGRGRPPKVKPSVAPVGC